jgi:hypothetical protein
LIYGTYIGDSGMSNRKKIFLRLNTRERQLFALYGYPFAELEVQLEQAATEKGVATLSIHPNEVGALTADFVYSAKKINDMKLLDEIDALITKIESQIKFRSTW